MIWKYIKEFLEDFFKKFFLNELRFSLNESKKGIYYILS